MNEVTRIINAIQQGDGHASEELLPLVYEELRLLAAQKMGQEKPGQTLQATALVHEAYIRLMGSGEQEWDNSGGSFLEGLLDDGRIYDRALSAKEIAEFAQQF